ncbi:MAG: FAD-linked oxidase C-terminal domain-containing protein [Candidatus Azotimanducaceae bacterium WSBS_2022_MAG_OTU7]
MPINNQDFIKRLGAIAGDLITDNERLAVYETDGLTAKKQLPGVVVIPDTVAQVQAIVALCHTYEVPLVARGAGTGLSGGAMPHSEGVLMVMARFNQIVDVDTSTRTATVQPGVTNLAISEAVSSLGLYYAPDPSSQIACTIGGNVAENSGGVHCLKYGLTVHNVKRLKVVLPGGELIVIGGKGYDTPGYDLLALMHGSEGLLGVVVEVVVQLLPKPPEIAVIMAAFSNVVDAANSVSGVLSEGLLPAGLEMMDKLAIQAAEAFVGAGYPEDAAAMLLCELDGSAEELQVLIEAVRTVFKAQHCMTFTVAWEAEERQGLWLGRKAAFPAVGRIAPDYYCMDGTIPRRELANVLQAITDLSQKYELQVANVFHAGDGNLHPLILYDANNSDQLARAEAFGSEVLALCLEKGGTITGEHGVGVEKINEMCLQFDRNELGIFHGIKKAFDDRGILNPGKGIPTLSRCAEFGAMHVHAGEERFPHLDRF